jgi:hypothetical protein
LSTDGPLCVVKVSFPVSISGKEKCLRLQITVCQNQYLESVLVQRLVPKLMKATFAPCTHSQNEVNKLHRTSVTVNIETVVCRYPQQTSLACPCGEYKIMHPVHWMRLMNDTVAEWETDRSHEIIIHL